MRILLLKNLREKDNNKLKTIELFGLSRSGKTTLLKDLIKKGNKGLLTDYISLQKKIFLSLRYFLIHPLKTVYLFYKLNTNWIVLPFLKPKDYFLIWKMRNSYLSSVLAKYQIVKNSKDKIYLDEFLIQSIFMIIQRKSNKKEIMDILDRLPPSGEILIIGSNKIERYNRIKNTRFPAQQINKDYSIEWMKNSEYNYKIIKKILIKKYGPIDKIWKKKITL